MSSFGKNVFLKTLNNEAEPDPNPPIIPDPLTINQLNVNQIGDNSNPCETIHVASTFLLGAVDRSCVTARSEG